MMYPEQQYNNSMGRCFGVLTDLGWILDVLEGHVGKHAGRPKQSRQHDIAPQRRHALENVAAVGALQKGPAHDPHRLEQGDRPPELEPIHGENRLLLALGSEKG